MKQQSKQWMSVLGLVLIGAAAGLALLALLLPKTVEGAVAPVGVVAAPAVQAAPLSIPGLDINMVGKETVFPGAPVTYTVRITNTSGAVINNIILTDTWTTAIPQTNMWSRGILADFDGIFTSNPPGAVSYFTYTVSERQGIATWELDPLPAGHSVELKFIMTTPITLQPALSEDVTWARVGPSVLNNSIVATVPGVGEEPAPLVTTLVVAPLIRVEHEVVGEAAPDDDCRVGRIVTYTLHVQNVSAEGSLQRPDTWPAANLVVSATMPTQLFDTVLSWEATAPGVTWEYDSDTGKAAWFYPGAFVLMPGSDTFITLTARVPADSVYNPTRYLEMNKRYVEARADVMVRLTTGYNTTKSRIYSPFDKTVETTAPPDDPAKTFPNRNIKYTITFYNPLQQPVDDMVLQDTMFGTFSYVGTISGPAPAWDVDNVVRWEGLDLTANGVISMVFEAFVPPHTLPDTCDVSHYNAVSATHALFSVPQYTGHDNNQISTGRVIVERQLKLSKSVVPTLQVPGEEVTYTIKLQNIGDSDIPYPVLLTDTLPAPFTFTAMVSDTPGDPTISGTLLIWDDIPDIPAYTEFEFSFRAEVDGITYATYKNNLAAYSPETAICPIEAAGVKIDLPFRLNKFASTTVITQGDTFSYDAEIFNIHPNRTYYVTSFEDFLPEGFTDVTDGDEHYAFDVNPPAELAPEFGSWPTGPFFVRVDGRGLGTEWCVDRALPGKDVSQTPGHVVFHISPEFEAGIANASSLAKVEVIPHVYLLQEAYPNPVAINEVQILTFTLKDNRTTPAGDITGVDLHWLSPIVGEEEFTFIESTPPPTMVVYPDYYWESLTIPAGGEAVVVLKIRAPEPLNADAKRDYSSRADVLELDDMDICIPPSYRYNLEVRRGLEILKYPTPDIVGPYGLVEYRLRVSNLTGAPVSGAVITDVLPLNWEYVDMVSGPEPISTDPPVWELPTLGPETNMEIEFNARSYVWVGPAFNEVEGRAPINIDYHKSYTNNVEVMVVSGIGFYKTVGPDTIVAGETTVYTITLYNGLEDDIKNIVITDTLPTGITFDVMLEGPEPLSIGEQLVWQIPQNLNDGRSLQLVFRVQSSPLMPNGTYYNEVEATATNAQTGSPEVIPATGPTAPLMVEGLEPVVAAKQVNPTTVRAGERVTYSITLYNESDDRTYALVVTDTLPGGLTFVGPGTPPPAQVLPGTRQRVVWSSFSIAPLETLTLTFQADVDDSLAGGTYCNDVDVAMDAFVLGYHDLACLTVTEVPRVDAQISKDDGVTRVSGGDTLTYTIRYTNAASSALPLNNVVLTETIAPLEYVTVLSTGDWVDLGGGQYRFSHPTSLTPGQSGETTFVVRLDATVPATAVLSVANQVQIGYDTVEPAIEANPDDNVAVDVDAWQGPDLVITGITVEPDEPIAGEPMYVHVTVKNQGTSPADQRHDGSYVPGVDWWLFVVELYMKEAAFVPAGAPVDVFDHLGGYCPNFACNPSRGEFLGWPDTLGVGASQELVYTLTAPDPGHYSLYAQADVTWVGWFGGQPYGLIIEAIEDNNIFIGPTVLLEDDENLLFLPLIVR